MFRPMAVAEAFARGYAQPLPWPTTACPARDRPDVGAGARDVEGEDVGALRSGLGGECLPRVGGRTSRRG